jgi:glutaminyl-tRNA synthetase
LSALRRKGYTPTALGSFIKGVGVARVPSTIDYRNMEYHIREELNKTANRVMAVLHPLKLVIDNYPEGQTEEFDAENNPEDPAAGSRKIPFSREIFIEREDFREEAPRKWFRFAPGREVRLKHAYYVTCTEVVKNDAGEVVELHGTYDPASRGGWTDDGRKVKGTSHWVSAAHARQAEVRIYDHLFTKEDPTQVEDGQTFRDNLNPNSLQVLTRVMVEPSLVGAPVGERYQFLRQGYFCVDPDSRDDLPVFNRIVGLRDSWARIAKKG